MRPSERARALTYLAPGLHAIYKRNLDRLESDDDRNIASRTLTILLYSRHPLRLRSLATAASVDPDYDFDKDQRVDEDGNIFACCGSLIKINKATDFVELSHISVRQFLQTKDLNKDDSNPYYVDEAEGNIVLMRLCFSYLNSPWLLPTITQFRDDAQALSQLKLKFEDKFSFYAVYEWVEHAKKVQAMRNAARYIANFLTGPSFYPWRELWELPSDVRNHPWWETGEDGSQEEILWSSRTLCEIRSAFINPGTPLYYTADFGFYSVAELLLTDPKFQCDPNQAGGPQSYPLLAALENDHIRVVELLLREGGNVNVQHTLNEHTALHRAIEKADKPAIQLLLSQKPDPAIRNDKGFPPLHWALRSKRGIHDDSQIITMLAEPPFINAKDISGRTALHLAAVLNNFEHASILVEKKAEVNMIDVQEKTALHAASRNGNVEVVDLLLKHKANVITADRVGYTAVHEAVRSGNVALFAKLFDESGMKLPMPIFHLTSATVCSGKMHAKLKEPVELAQLLVDAYPDDILYLNVLAEAKLENGNITEAYKIFDNAVIKDEKNINVLEWLSRKDGQLEPADLERISHRAFCGNCHGPICGIRQKCTSSKCGEFECCEGCLKFHNRSNICDQHHLILIPSVERIAEKILGGKQNSRR
jgi:ankyrin repeat protein